MIVKDDTATVLSRLDCVERQFRHWRRAALLALLAPALLAIGSAANPGVPDVIEAGRFVVRDGKDNVRVSFGYDPVEDRQELFFYDPGRKPRLGLVHYSGFEAAVGIQGFDIDGDDALIMGVTTKDAPAVRFRCAARASIASMRVNPSGLNGLEFVDQDRPGRFSLGANPGNQLALAISDRGGKVRAALMLFKGSITLILRNKANKYPIHSKD